MRALLSVAPVTAVRGNSDKGHWTKGLHDTETFEVCGMLFHLLHDLSALDLDPRAAGIHAVISGHSHRPVISEKDGVLYLNPGSAGPRRFTLPVTLARIRIRNSGLLPEIIHLQ
jgi:predicted phosphodiesterase